MKTAIAFAALLFATPAFADKTITDNNKTATIDCATDATVSIEGNGNTVAMTGACTHVRIAGNHNTVTAVSSAAVDVPGNENTVSVVSVDALSVSGNKNAVDYKTAVAKGGKTKVSNPGTGNKVTKSK